MLLYQLQQLIVEGHIFGLYFTYLFTPPPQSTSQYIISSLEYFSVSLREENFFG